MRDGFDIDQAKKPLISHQEAFLWGDKDPLIDYLISFLKGEAKINN